MYAPPFYLGTTMAPSVTDKRLGAHSLFLAAFVIYLAGLSPSIYWRDSSEFVTVVDGLGISHPAGSPTYSLVAKWLTLVPIGSIAFRVNVFSALMGALTVSLLFVLVYDLLETSPRWRRLLAAASGAVFLMVSESFWRFSEVAEVYTLQNAAILVLLILLRSARPRQVLAAPAAVNRYYLFAFLYGLSAGVHVTMALFAPAFLVLMWGRAPRMMHPRRLAFLAFFFLFGFAAYLYLPIRSWGNPAFDWGDPQTWQQFLTHLLDKKDAGVHIHLSWDKLPYQIFIYGKNLLNEFSLLGVLLGVVGCARAFALDGLFGWALLLVYLGNVGFFIRIWTLAFGFLPSFVIFAVWISLGVHACLTAIVRLYDRWPIRIPQRLVQAWVLGAVAIVLGLACVRHGATASQAQNYTAEQYGRQLLKQLPSDAIVLSDYGWFLLQYMQTIERRRPDITVILRQAVLSPQYYTPLSQVQFPNVYLSNTPEPLRMTTEEYFWFFSKLNAPTHAIFFEPQRELETIYDHLLPSGLLYKFSPFDKPLVTPEILDRHWRLLNEAAAAIFQGRFDTESRNYFIAKLIYFGWYFRQKKLPNVAAKTYELGLQILPTSYPVLMEYGKLLVDQKHYRRASQLFNSAYDINPLGKGVNKILGMLLLQEGKYRQALRFFRRALHLGLINGDTYSLLAESDMKLGRFAEAREDLESALAFYTKADETAPADSEAASPGTESSTLEDKRAWVQTNLRHLEQGANERLIPLEQVWKRHE